MRACLKTCILLLTVICLCGDDTPTYQNSYQQLLESSRRSYGVNESLDSHRWKKWDGLNKIEGIRSVVDDLARAYYERTGQIDGARVGLAYWMLGNTELKQREILGVIIKKADESRKNPAALSAYFRLIEKYMDEPAALSYVAKHLSDTRISPFLRVKLDRRTFYTTMDHRVCDFAIASIMRWMEKEDIWKPGDPGYADHTGTSNWEDKNKLIDQVNKILLDKEFIQYAVSPSDPVPRDRLGRAKEEVQKGRPPRQERVEESASTEEQPSGTLFPRWSLALVLGLVLCAVAFVLKVRASSGR